MRRAHTGVEDSLELLLDTICNTFGGILFIALLVCLLTRESGETAQTAAKTDELIQRRYELKTKQSELEIANTGLAGAVANQKRQVALVQSLSSTGDRATISRLIDVRARTAELDAQIEKTARQIRDTNRERSNEEIKAAEARRAIEEANQQVQSATEKEREIRETKTLRLRLPMARETSKRQIGMFVCDGRIRLPRHYSREGFAISTNFDVVKPDTPENRIAPRDLRPNSGLAVVDSAESRAAIAGEIRRFDKETCYIFLAVWPDSYQQFQIVKDVLTREGYDYQLLLLGDGEPVGYGSSGRSEVQ